MPPTSSVTQPDPGTFQREYERTFQHLRGALTQLYAASGADPSRPQEVTRRFGINRNVSWKLGKLIHGSDPYQGASHLPGSAGMEIVLEAFARSGTPAEELQRVREAWADFEEMMRRHAGDRRGLVRLLASLSAEAGDADAGLAHRRSAFESQAAVWGAQARLRLTISVMAPSSERSGWLDMATIGGLCDFRRLRDSTRWPLLQQQTFSDTTELAPTAEQPIDPRAAERGEAPLLLDYCSSPTPPIRTIRRDNTLIHELEQGAIGNTAVMDVLFGYTRKAWAPIYAEGPDEVGEHYSRIDTPVERVQFDLLVHRDLPFPMPPRSCLYGMLHGRIDFPLSRHEEFFLPHWETVEDLGRPPVLASPHSRRNGELVELACRSLGKDVSEFHAYRCSIAYPPIPSFLVLHHPLPVAGA